MITILDMRSLISLRISYTWESISEAVRLRASPKVPVWQKAQFMAQPTWHETQAVFLPSLSVRRTVSTAIPSCKEICSFMVPSGSVSTLETLQQRKSAFWSSSERKAELKFVICEKFSAPFPIHSKIWRPRKEGETPNFSVISSGRSPVIEIFSAIFLVDRPVVQNFIEHFADCSTLCSRFLEIP